jgi:hypothetical protein
MMTVFYELVFIVFIVSLTLCTLHLFYLALGYRAVYDISDSLFKGEY